MGTSAQTAVPITALNPVLRHHGLAPYMRGPRGHADRVGVVWVVAAAVGVIVVALPVGFTN
jgi:hypothetical protein